VLYFDTIDRLAEGVIRYFSPVASQYVPRSKNSENITTGSSPPIWHLIQHVSELPLR